MSRKKQDQTAVKTPAVTTNEKTARVRVTDEGLVDDPETLRDLAAQAMEGLSLMIAVAMKTAEMTYDDLGQFAQFVKVNYPLVAKVQWEGKAQRND